MYDIAIMLTGVPDTVIVEQETFALSFRVSHLNDHFLTWFAEVRVACAVVTGLAILLYFVTSCSKSGFKINIHMEQLNLNQCCILVLLFLCLLYDEPLFELRMKNPSVALAVVSEVPASLFLTGLLTYWLMSVAYVRVSLTKL